MGGGGEEEWARARERWGGEGGEGKGSEDSWRKERERREEGESH